ncbi:MAG: aminotransferase class I/II-fold pyridoxal phosphate-dependent enzyme [Candidatus Gastranaerophilales bacterium]|nr:aminotransferase class I/II-fold pyridoxal phosphate-dependent enzyme [Candidatus Gastranaerophilales bacterium]
MLKPKKSVQNMAGYFVPLYERLWDIKIDSNENNYGSCPEVLECLKNTQISDVSFYPFYGELSQQLADFNGFDISNIKITNGADEALQSIVQTYMENGESLLTLDISFEMPVIYAQIQGGNIIRVPFKEKWKFPVADFIRELDNSSVKIVYLASPNNPTGNIIEENDLKNILDKSPDKVVIIDETYANYAGVSYKDFVKRYDNVFIVKSFSKDFALAGMRLGYIISNSENINNLKKVVSPFSVNSLAMKAGICALKNADYFNKIRENILKSGQDLKIFFESLGAVVYDSKANFLLVDFKQKSEFIYNKLRNENIAVKLFKKGSKLENHLRVTIPTFKGVEKIKNVLAPKPFLVFDMDGVLVDAGQSYRIAIARTFKKFSGKEAAPEDIQSAKNLGGLNNDWDLTQYLLKKSGIEIPYNRIVEEFQKIYWNEGNGLINNETPLFNSDLFEKLSKNYNLAIYTGRPAKEALFTLNKFKITKFFSLILTSDDVEKGQEKPNPFGLNQIKNMTIADNYYYFGDTQDDIIAAKAAGYNAIGVLPPQDKSEVLKTLLHEKGANVIINSVNDLLEILEQKNEAVC